MNNESHHVYSLKCTYLIYEQYMQTIQGINKQLNEWWLLFDWSFYLVLGIKFLLFSFLILGQAGLETVPQCSL